MIYLVTFFIGDKAVSYFMTGESLTGVLDELKDWWCQDFVIEELGPEL